MKNFFIFQSITIRLQVFFRLAIISLSFLALSNAYAERQTLLRVGVFDNKPIVFKDANGAYQGLSLDVLESIAKEENWKIEYKHGPWKSVFAQLEAGKIDLLVGIAYKPERAKFLDYTSETLISNWGVVYKDPSAKVTSLQDLNGKRVAMMTQSIHSRVFKRMMKEFDFDFTEVSVPNYREALKSVDSKNADAAVINRVMSILNAADFHVIETGVIFNPVEVRYASQKGRHAHVLAAIDRHLSAQKKDPSSVYNMSLAKWLGSMKKHVFPVWIYAAGSILFLVLLVLSISNYIIRKKVLHRTAELSESESRFRQLAENINEVFWIGSPDWSEVFYVSPLYEKVWGNTRSSLYERPVSWFESVHPDDQEKLRNEIKIKSSGDLGQPQFSEYRLISKEGKIIWISARAYPIRDAKGKVSKIAGIAEDVTQRKKSEETIRFMAYHDSLTKLSNRNAFEYKLLAAIEHARTHAENHVLMYIDLDQFKVVNDTCGHSAGDEMLRNLANMLESMTDSDTTLARLGGDEFGMLIENTNLEYGIKKAHEYLDAIQLFRFIWEDRKFSVGASIGLVVIGDDYKAMSELLSAADMACYAAKEMGRNRVHVYSDDDADLLRRHGEMQWVSRLKSAIEEDRFVLYQQIIAPLQDRNNDYTHCEFLIRLLDEDGELIQPGHFLPAAERFDLMPALDRWVVKNVFEYLADLRKRDKGVGHSIAFINLSGHVLTDEGFIDFVLNEFDKSGLSPSSVCFEITETAAIGNLQKANDFILRLRKEGCYFALDDFGTGMSSFSYLKSLPVDFLKIDGSFIQGLLDDPMNTSIVDAIARVGHAANLKIIAEWVENEAVSEELQKIGIDFAQGYGIQKPQPVSLFDLSAQSRLGSGQ